MSAAEELQLTLNEVAPTSFIYEIKGALSPGLCNSMIDQFERLKDEQYPGCVALGRLEPDLKRSTDLQLRGQAHWEWADRVLVESLRNAVAMLQGLYPIFREDLLEDCGYQIQRTLPGEFYHWHKDLNQHSRRRVLVAIWYLNDVPAKDGGATEFLRQDVKVQPEVGKLVLFPPYWTHVHRGGVLKAGAKYICTTWVAYAGANDYADGVEYGDGYATVETD